MAAAEAVLVHAPVATLAGGHELRLHLREITGARRITVMASELGGANQRNDHYAARGASETMNVLRSPGMLPGEPRPPSGQAALSRYTIVRPHHGLADGSATADFPAAGASAPVRPKVQGGNGI